MSERFARLEAVIGPASEMDPVDARAWLAEQFAEEPDLLAEAEALLEAGTRDDAFMEAPHPGRAKPAGTLRPGTTIGGYRLVHLLGEGGMGAVFLAEQASPRRSVALKLLTAPWLRPTSLDRFRYEVQALAALRHPGVAQVYETGVHVQEAGPARHELPWFAMEYVEGARSVLAYAEEEALDVADRLKLFADVCDAVHHAHQKGVVHRDLKPDNILVDASGRVKVIDFGVARIADEDARLTTLRTSSAEIAGTLPYMAPEQVRGDGGADVRADVYALGVILFELLTGERPIELGGRDFVTAARRIVEQPPRQPSRLRPELKGDLEAIVLKALEKDVARRYGSADELARDINRYLTHRPIEARIPGALYQLRLFARRHRPVVIALGALFLVAVAAAVVSSAFAVRSETARREAEGQRKRAEDLLETALRSNVDTMFRFFPRILKMPDGAEVAGDLAAAVREDVERLEALTEADPRVRVILANAWMKLAQAQGSPDYSSLRAWDDAEASYERALDLLEGVVASGHSSYELRITRVRTRRQLARLHAFHSRNDEAETLAALALPEAEALASEFPTSVDVLSELATIHDIQGDIAGARKKHGEAVRQAGLGIDAYRRMLAAAPDREDAQRGLMRGYYDLAMAQVLQGETAASRRTLVEALAVLDQVSPATSRSFSQRLNEAQLRHLAGSAAAEDRDDEAAERHLLEARTVIRALHAERPKDQHVRPNALMILMTLAQIPEERAGAHGLEPDEVRRHLERAAGFLEEAHEIAGSGRFAASLRRRIEALRARMPAR